MIIKAETSDHQILSKITKASKAHWGYSAAQMELWDEELTIAPWYIKNNFVYKLVENNEAIGYYSLEKKSGTVIKLENLFVLPKFIGKGYGKILLDDIFKKSLDMGVKEIITDADPNAYLFYEKNGFEIIGKKETSIENRYLPIMRKKLNT